MIQVTTAIVTGNVWDIVMVWEILDTVLLKIKCFKWFFAAIPQFRKQIFLI